ncbi:VOC family protein [uncultured Shewanella sp.]|uniref:VOC family protein n=1 Tax=Shewanella atlantica TaxID=271099 RepID=UPI002634B1D7|nr:VOC family protein [uncultured Shewanella sp.]
MKVERYAQGLPCWVELASHDANAGKQFYSELLGWSLQDMPIPDGVYTMFNLVLGEESDEIGAAYQMPAEMSEQGIPTNWTVYFAVDSVDATIALARSNGGELLLGPHDVGTAGRMALLRDPQGAKFAIWQAGEHIGARRRGESGTLCWVELACRNTGLAKQFYPKILDWKVQPGDIPGFEYTEWLVDGEPFGGMMEMTEEWGDIDPHWMLYFTVADCDETVVKATKIGGKICVPPTNIPKVGRFAVIKDPQGGVFSVIALNT